eukprot:scaffold565_cov137-Amphora_coffeaeformis.AAC.2
MSQFPHLAPHSTSTAIPMEIAFDAFMAESQDTSSPVDFVQTIIPPDLSPDNNNSSGSDDDTSTTTDGWSNNKSGITTPQEGYTMEAVNAIRSNNVEALRSMWAAGQSFNACNSNGEYLIHLACRRSRPETVEFLLESGARADVRDRQGRTILHDVCWKSKPDVEMMAVVLRLAPPELLLARDHRGHTPFDFARKQHSQQWNEFLTHHRDLIQERLFAQYFNKALLAEQQQQQEQEARVSQQMEYSSD